MGKFRRVSATNAAEAQEVQVSGAVDNGNGTYGITVGNISSWANNNGNGDELDFITYARDVNGNVDESTRVVWNGTKVSNTYITAKRVGGSATYLPDATGFAAVVATHFWANEMVEQLRLCLPDDGRAGIKSTTGNPQVIIISASQPSSITGRTVIWLKPL
jgi:hypothetical protein